MKKLIKKGQTGTILGQPINLRNLATGGLKVLNTIGTAFNNLLTGSAYADFGQTSPFADLDRRQVQKGQTRAKKAAERAIGTIGTYTSPSNYIAAATQGSLNPKKGKQLLGLAPPEIQLAASLFDLGVLLKTPVAVKKAPATVDRALASAGSRKAAARTVAREINNNVKNTQLSTSQVTPPPRHTVTVPINIPEYETTPTTFRTSARQYRDWVFGDNPITTLDNPESAFIELRSHPDGHATVAERHLTDKSGNDITFTFDEGINKDNVLQLEFDDSHGSFGSLDSNGNGTLTLEEVQQALDNGMWKGSEVSRNPRSLTFQNITPQQADQVVRFIDDNLGKNMYIHCLRGTSRSGAFDKFLEDFYGYTRPSKKNTTGYSEEVYKALTDAYKRSPGHQVYEYHH